MQRINGKPSVFMAVENPNQPLPNFQEQWIQTSRQMAAEAEQAEQEWLADEAAQAEYQEYLDSVHSQPSDAELDRMAEEYELARLGDGAAHYIAGHDTAWQQGVC